MITPRQSKNNIALGVLEEAAVEDIHKKRVLALFVENQDGKVEGSKSITERKQVLKGEVRHRDSVKESKLMRQDLIFNEGSHPSSCWSVKGMMSGTLHMCKRGIRTGVFSGVNGRPLSIRLFFSSSSPRCFSKASFISL